MAQARLLYDNPRGRRSQASLVTTATTPTLSQPDTTETDDILRQVSGNVQEAAERSSTGYNPPTYPTTVSSGPTGGNYQDWFNSLTSSLSPTPTSLSGLESQLGQYNVKVLRNASGVAGKIQLPDGQIVDVGQSFSSGDPSRMRWQWMTGNSGGLQPSAYSAQFSDPLTKQYEELLRTQTDLYKRQQKDMDEETALKKSTRAATDVAVKRLMDFLNKRVEKLEQPAYTDSEANIIKTRLLDPLESDRTASQQRALTNVGARGFDPTSGIAQQLFQDVDREYDKTRSRVHGDVAYEQIQEERDREREAQDLLKYLAQLPEASARGDLDFVNYLDDLVSRPGEKALTSSALLSDLPVQRTQLALQALGYGGQPISSVNGALSLLDNSRQNRLYNNQTTSDFWKSIGLSF